MTKEFQDYCERVDLGNSSMTRLVQGMLLEIVIQQLHLNETKLTVMLMADDDAQCFSRYPEEISGEIRNIINQVAKDKVGELGLPRWE